VLARDVVINQITRRDGDVSFDKRITIDQGFYIEMAEFPKSSRGEISGFGLTARRDERGFSWEWFDVDGDAHAVKLQESGELAITPVAVASRWEIGQTKVLKEISLRIYDGGTLAVWRNAPRCRIKLRAGSEVNWPSVQDGTFVMHELPGLTARPN
jgi:hypothetical protein